MDRSYAARLAAGSATGPLSSLRTRLVQRTISNLGDANREFMDSGKNGDEVALVLRHQNSSCCFNFLLQIPSGPNVRSFYLTSYARGVVAMMMNHISVHLYFAFIIGALATLGRKPRKVGPG